MPPSLSPHFRVLHPPGTPSDPQRGKRAECAEGPLCSVDPDAPRAEPGGSFLQINRQGAERRRSSVATGRRQLLPPLRQPHLRHKRRDVDSTISHHEAHEEHEAFREQRDNSSNYILRVLRAPRGRFWPAGEERRAQCADNRQSLRRGGGSPIRRRGFAFLTSTQRRPTREGFALTANGTPTPAARVVGCHGWLFRIRVGRAEQDAAQCASFRVSG